jgi:hypothetical protein
MWSAGSSRGTALEHREWRLTRPTTSVSTTRTPRRGLRQQRDLEFTRR